jgi:hypothetical protein
MSRVKQVDLRSKQIEAAGCDAGYRASSADRSGLAAAGSKADYEATGRLCNFRCSHPAADACAAHPSEEKEKTVYSLY